MADHDPNGLQALIRQSPPIDLSIPYDAAWVRDQTILVTGGASGFGAGFVRQWALHGATVIIGDVNITGGTALAIQLRKETGKENVHFVHCDVTSWESQVELFKEAVRLSPHGGIDCVVANAGIAGKDLLMFPSDLSVAAPAKPNFKTLEVNVTGVLYTVHLAYFWLPKNPGSRDCSTSSEPKVSGRRDRHILLVGSIASLGPITFAPQYGTSKAAILGLFRALRGCTHLHGVRINMLCPYFIDTAIVTTPTRLMTAGGGLGEIEDVVDAATRFVADTRVLGRALAVGPKMSLVLGENESGEGEWHAVDRGTPGSTERALWEPCADDWYETEAFNRTIVKALNVLQVARGWQGWAFDMFKTAKWALGFR